MALVGWQADAPESARPLRRGPDATGCGRVALGSSWATRVRRTPYGRDQRSRRLAAAAASAASPPRPTATRPAPGLAAEWGLVLALTAGRPGVAPERRRCGVPAACRGRIPVWTGEAGASGSGEGARREVVRRRCDGRSAASKGPGRGRHSPAAGPRRPRVVDRVLRTTGRASAGWCDAVGPPAGAGPRDGEEGVRRPRRRTQRRDGEDDGDVHMLPCQRLVRDHRASPSASASASASIIPLPHRSQAGASVKSEICRPRSVIRRWTGPGVTG
jgi:hypothetical protein